MLLQSNFTYHEGFLFHNCLEATMTKLAGCVDEFEVNLFHLSLLVRGQQRLEKRNYIQVGGQQRLAKINYMSRDM